MSEPTREELLNALADCVVKATEYGEQDGGFVRNYILPTGPIHRAIHLLDRAKVTARPGFDGTLRQPTAEQRAAIEAFVADMEDRVIPDIVATVRRRAEDAARIRAEGRPLFGGQVPKE